MKRLMLMGGLIACCFAASAAQTAQNKAPEQHAGKTKSVSTAPGNVGEVKFHQNCSRCHNAPQELSSRITGTVLLHMRVRASLSEADAKEILRYLAP